MGKAPKLRRFHLHIRLALPLLIRTSDTRELAPLIDTLAKGLERNLVPLGAVTTESVRVAQLPTFHLRMVQLPITVAGTLIINLRTTQVHLVETVQTLVHLSRARIIHMIHHHCRIRSIHMAQHHPIRRTIHMEDKHPIVTTPPNKVIGWQNAGALVHQRHQPILPQHQVQRAHEILVAEIISTFKAGTILLGAEPRCGADTDRDTGLIADRSSACDPSLYLGVNERPCN